jgi:hypothetical protein
MPETAKSAMNPLVLLGETRSRRNIELLRSKGWGRMFVVNRPTPYEGEPLKADSLDSAFPLWSNERLASFTAAWDCLQTQHVFKGFYS